MAGLSVDLVGAGRSRAQDIRSSFGGLQSGIKDLFETERKNEDELNTLNETIEAFGEDVDAEALDKFQTGSLSQKRAIVTGLMTKRNIVREDAGDALDIRKVKAQEDQIAATVLSGKSLNNYRNAQTEAAKNKILNEGIADQAEREQDSINAQTLSTVGLRVQNDPNVDPVALFVSTPGVKMTPEINAALNNMNVISPLRKPQETEFMGPDGEMVPAIVTAHGNVQFVPTNKSKAGSGQKTFFQQVDDEVEKGAFSKQEGLAMKKSYGGRFDRVMNNDKSIKTLLDSGLITMSEAFEMQAKSIAKGFGMSSDKDLGNDPNDGTKGAGLGGINLD